MEIPISKAQSIHYNLQILWWVLVLSGVYFCWWRFPSALIYHTSRYIMLYLLICFSLGLITNHEETPFDCWDRPLSQVNSTIASFWACWYLVHAPSWLSAVHPDGPKVDFIYFQCDFGCSAASCMGNCWHISHISFHGFFAGFPSFKGSLGADLEEPEPEVVYPLIGTRTGVKPPEVREKWMRNSYFLRVIRVGGGVKHDYLYLQKNQWMYLTGRKKGSNRFLHVMGFAWTEGATPVFPKNKTLKFACPCSDNFGWQSWNQAPHDMHANQIRDICW